MAPNGARITTNALVVEHPASPLRNFTWSPFASHRAFSRPPHVGLSRQRGRRRSSSLPGSRTRRALLRLGDNYDRLDLAGPPLTALALRLARLRSRGASDRYSTLTFVLTRTTLAPSFSISYDTLTHVHVYDFAPEHAIFPKLLPVLSIDDRGPDYYLIADDATQPVARFVRLISGARLPPRSFASLAQPTIGADRRTWRAGRLSAFVDRCSRTRADLSAPFRLQVLIHMRARPLALTWNLNSPGPRALTTSFQQHGIQLVANVGPCLLDDHRPTRPCAPSEGFIPRRDGKTLVDQLLERHQQAYLRFHVLAAIPARRSAASPQSARLQLRQRVERHPACA